MNVLFIFGSIKLVFQVIKDRNVLKGIDPIGSAFTAAGMITVQFAYWQLQTYTSIALSMPTLIFWIVTTFYSWRLRK